MVVYCDTGFLFSLYGIDFHSPRAVAWITGCTTPLRVNSLTHFEFGNALRFAEFRKLLKPAESARFWAEFEAIIAQGRVIVEPSNLADVVDEAKRLSASHTSKDGHWSFDILNVAGALVSKASDFLTFDANQKKLAESECLRVTV